jgi:hypothetical protein
MCSETAQERLSHVLFEYATKVGRKVAEGFEIDATNEEYFRDSSSGVHLFSPVLRHTEP